jgi:hypothetical protein
MGRLSAFIDRTLQPELPNPHAYVLLVTCFHVACFVLAVVLLLMLHYIHISVYHPVIQVGFGAFLAWLLWLKKKRSKKNVAN